jgi:hypothetical protein
MAGWNGEPSGLSPEPCARLASLMDAVHNIPDLVQRWDQCNEEWLRSELRAYDERWQTNGSLLDTYDHAVRSETSNSSGTLETIEWHDLPVRKVSISESGIELVVTPYIDELEIYGSCCLRIFDAEVLSVDLGGTLSSEDLEALEVSSFNYSFAPSGRITGTISILPGSAGIWTVSFTNALWKLENA